MRATSLWVRLRSSNIPLIVALAAALVLMLGAVNFHYPIAAWLVWRYLWVGGLALFWAASCLSCGYWLCSKLRLRWESRALEAVLAFPLGVLAFQGAIFLLGVVGALGVIVFLSLPLGFMALGARRLIEAGRILRAAARPPATFAHFAVILFGLAGVGLLYFQILSPEAMHWDARWYHLPIGQQYALQGSVRGTPEGWWLDGYPHSGSLIYAWAFLLPKALLFDRLELCLHLEFVIFLATIASIPVLVRQLAPEVEGRGAWAAIFLFPGVFLYDSNLAGAADHIAALWCIPITITLLRLWRRWEITEAILFGAFMGAGMASKYSAWAMLIFPGLLFWARAAGLVFERVTGRDRTSRRLLPPFLVVIGMMLVISAQFWLRNWICYGDPMYPLLHDHLSSKYWSPEASASFRVYKSFAFPPAAGWQGVRDAVLTMFTFAFIPNDWPVFHRNVPVFGFLFTLSMFCLPVIRTSVRLWLTYLGVLVAMIFWYLTIHQDRYLQVWLPAMVACTIVTFAVVWRRGNLAVRGLVTALVAFQILWGGDVPFFPTHNQISDSPIRLVSNFLASGFLQKQNRLRLFGDEGLVAERLPPDANLLIHETNMHVGFGVRAVNDQWQGRLSYAALGSPAAIYRELADMKVTHLVWESKMSGWNSLGHDLAFLGFAFNHAVDPVAVGRFNVARFPSVAPQDPFNERVAVMACDSPYANGIYNVSRMMVPDPGQPWASPAAPLGDPQTAIRSVGFLVVDPACAPPLPPDIGTLFHPPMGSVRGPLQMYVRRR
ncbi:MAG: hypothetical protein ABJA82_02290 [Myxococcales bacterium]